MKRTITLGLATALLSAAVFALFGLSLWTPLIFDDQAFVLEDPRVTGPWPGLGAFFLETFTLTKEYEPLVFLIHRLLYCLSGPWPLLYRLSSLLLHCANSLLLFLLLRRFFKDRLALGLALLFAIYPAHSETLAISTFKKHLLVGLAALSILNWQAAIRSDWLRRAGCWALLPVGLFAKESALLIPFFAVGMGWAPPEARGRSRDKTLWLGLFAIAALYVLARITIIPRWYPPFHRAWPERLLTSGKCLIWYLGQSLLPWQLCIEQSLSSVRSALSLEGLGIALALAAIAAGFWTALRKDRTLALGLGWSLLALAPFLNLLPYLNLSIVANRYLYLASMGFMLFFGRLLQLALARQALPKRRAPILLALGGLTLAYGVLDLRYMILFADPLELWSRAQRCAPRNPRAYSNLGHYQLGAGRTQEAIVTLENSIKIAPAMPEARLALAIAYSESGQVDKAIRITREGMELDPNMRTHEALNNLGLMQAQAGQRLEAEKSLRQAVDMAPDQPLYRLNLGVLQLENGALDRSKEQLLVAARHSEYRLPAYESLARLFLKKKRPKVAARFYEKVLELHYLHRNSVRTLARIYLEQGGRAKAADLYDRTLSRLRKDLFGPGRYSEDPRVVGEARRLLEGLEQDRSELGLRTGRG